MAILLRSRSVSDQVSDSLTYWNEVRDVLFARIGGNVSLQQNAQLVLDHLYAQVTAAVASNYIWDPWSKSGAGQPLMYSADASIPPERIGTPMWFVMNSMRNVEADAMLKIVVPENGSANNGGGNGQPAPVIGGPAPVSGGEDDF